MAAKKMSPATKNPAFEIGTKSGAKTKSKSTAEKAHTKRSEDQLSFLSNDFVRLEAYLAKQSARSDFEWTLEHDVFFRTEADAARFCAAFEKRGGSVSYSDTLEGDTFPIWRTVTEPVQFRLPDIRAAIARVVAEIASVGDYNHFSMMGFDEATGTFTDQLRSHDD
jgi:hypothetical protein